MTDVLLNDDYAFFMDDDDPSSLEKLLDEELSWMDFGTEFDAEMGIDGGGEEPQHEQLQEQVHEQLHEQLQEQLHEQLHEQLQEQLQEQHVNTMNQDIDFYKHDVVANEDKHFPDFNDLSLQDVKKFTSYKDSFANHEACKAIAFEHIHQQILHLKTIRADTNRGIVPTPPMTSTMTITTQLSFKDIGLNVVRNMMDNPKVTTILSKYKDDFVMEIKSERRGMYNACAVTIDEVKNHVLLSSHDATDRCCDATKKPKRSRKVKTGNVTKRSSQKRKKAVAKAHGEEAVNSKSLRVYSNGTLHIVGCVTTVECMKYADIMCEILRALFNRDDITIMDATINMINTNFKIPGYCIKSQDAFRSLHALQSKRGNIKATYQPLNHAAVQVKYSPSTRSTPATIMIFHTGNILITGFVKWSELKEAYIFITSFLAENIGIVGVPVATTTPSL